MRKKGERKEEIQEKEEGIIFEIVYLFLISLLKINLIPQ